MSALARNVPPEEPVEAAAPAAAPEPAPPGAAIRALGASIHVRQDRGTTWLALLCGALTIVVLAVVTFGHFARTETVRGYVSATSGLSRLDAQANGIVDRILVPQGGMVKAGQPIMTVKLREMTTKGVSTVSATVVSLEQRRINLVADRARVNAYLAASANDGAQLKATSERLAAAAAEHESDLRKVLDSQDEMVRRVRKYLQAGYATRDALNTYERAAFDYQRQLSEIRVRRAELAQQTTDRTRVQQQTILEKQAALSTIDSELALVDAQLAATRAKSELDILSPVDGQVAGLLTEIGASVLAEQVVAIVGDPKAEPVVVLEAPARAIGLAKVGQQVVLKYDAFPYKTFGVSRGVITAIASSPMKAPASSERAGLADPRPAAATAMAEQSVYRIEVKPDTRVIQAYGREEQIALGSTLSADIVIERRRLIDWVLDPIRAMRGRG